MLWGWGRRAAYVRERRPRTRAFLLAAGCALALAACNETRPPNVSAALPRGATVAFESIDGPPVAQFRKLVDNLNDEAQARRLAVISRGQSSAYRVRGYLAARLEEAGTTVSWVWDVFDGDEHRTLRITGEETAKAHRDAWNAADDAMLRRIARTSMDQLATFLTATDVAPGTPMRADQPQIALGMNDPSPEAAGIFRIIPARADPVAGRTAENAEESDAVPLPQRRPEAAISVRETLTLAASRRH